MSLTFDATLRLVDDLRRRGQDFCLVTVVRTANATSAKAGAKAVVTADGVLHGFVGGGCVQGAVRKAAIEAMRSGEPRLMRVKPKEEVDQPVDRDGVELHSSSCPSGGTVEFFLEPTRQRLRLVILGNSPVAAALMRLGHAMGYQTVTSAEGGGEPAPEPPHQVIEAFDLTGLDLRKGDAVVVATQGRRDRMALEAALRSPAGYVAMIGSRKKISALLDQLGDALPEERKQDLHGPAGLDLGAIEPEEIALSILGEMIMKRRSAKPGFSQAM